MKIQTFNRAECDCVWAARRKASLRSEANAERSLFLLELAAIVLSALLYIVHVTPN
jgi:hypothetical protein